MIRGALIIAALAAGCTCDAGTGFATMDDAVLSAALEPGPGREIGGGFLTDAAYEVRVDRAVLEVERVELQELSAGGGGGGGETFDPAAPPLGYTLCHGGHCHAEDGRLVDYVDIEAELAGGGATFSAVVTMPFGRELDLLAAEPTSLDVFEPSAELPESTLSRLVVVCSRLSLTGTVTAGALGDVVVPLVVDLEPAGTIASGIDRPVDRDHPASIRLAVEVVLDGTLLDETNLSALVVDGRIEIDSPDAAGAEAVLGAIGRTEPEVMLD